MKVFAWIACLTVCLVVVASVSTNEGAFYLAFGWFSFLKRVIPNISVDPASVVAGAVALILFVAIVHWFGTSWRRRATKTDPSAAPWKFRWSAIIVSVIVVLFAAGVSMIGMVHQMSWLATSDRPILGQRVRMENGAERSLKIIDIGISNHRDTIGLLPKGGTFSPDGEMLHSWETEILPFIGYSVIGADMKRPWNDPVNQKYFKCVLPSFINSDLRSPDIEDKDGYGLSHYAANIHVMAGNKALDSKSLTSNTILVGEVNARFKPWGHPVNWRDPTIGLNRSPNGFGGPRGSGGAHFLMYDGSVQFLSNTIDAEVLKKLSSP